jgi:hypothetical protein
LGQPSKGDGEKKKKKKGPAQQRPHRRDQLPDVVFYAIFRILPPYKRAIDGLGYIEKQKAWCEITEKLCLDPELRRDLSGQAESVLANLDPTILMQRFVSLKHNANIALQSQSSVNPLYQKILQFYPNDRDNARRMNTV